MSGVVAGKIASRQAVHLWDAMRCGTVPKSARIGLYSAGGFPCPQVYTRNGERARGDGRIFGRFRAGISIAMFGETCDSSSNLAFGEYVPRRSPPAEFQLDRKS